jgi:hypothetical protein
MNALPLTSVNESLPRLGSLVAKNVKSPGPVEPGLALLTDS